MVITEKGKNWRNDDRIMSQEFAPLLMEIVERCEAIDLTDLVENATRLYKEYGSSDAAISALRSGDGEIMRRQ